MRKIGDPYSFSRESREAGLRRPGQKQACSTDGGWQSVLLQTYSQPATVEVFETEASPDHLFVFCLEGDYRIESFARGLWHPANYRPGLGGYTSPLTQNRLRWRSSSYAELKVLRLYIPDNFFQEAGEELRPVGSALRSLPDSLLFNSPTVFRVAASLLQQMLLGASNLYAEAAARVIAADILSSHQLGLTRDVSSRPRPLKPDRRLQRAFEFLSHSFREDLTLARLALEAGMSPFHFSREYKAQFGYTPHRHQVRLRLRHARELLLHTDLSVQEVTLDCGYSHGGHFAAAFRAEFGVEPLTFRSRSRKERPL